MLNIFSLIVLAFLYLPSTVSAAPLDAELSQTYAAMHDDCISDRYLNNELINAMFVEMDTLKVMELLRDRNIKGFADQYLDPALLKKKRKKIHKTYQKLDRLLDLRGRGLSFDDMSNAYLAAGLMLYRYMHFGAASYGVIPKKEWQKIDDDAWLLKFSFGEKTENFYFRRIGQRWYLTDKKFLGAGGY